MIVATGDIPANILKKKHPSMCRNPDSYFDKKQWTDMTVCFEELYIRVQQKSGLPQLKWLISLIQCPPHLRRASFHSTDNDTYSPLLSLTWTLTHFQKIDSTFKSLVGI